MLWQEMLLPGGKEATEDFPCDPDAEHSPCCAGTPLGLACLANKLCLSPAGRFARGSCTDPTWKSPECPKFCTHQTGKGWDLVSCSNVTQTDTFYCCDGMADCCNGGIGRQEIQPPPSLTWAMWDSEQTRYDVVTPLATAETLTTLSTRSTTTTSSTPELASSSSSSSSPPPTEAPSESTGSEPSSSDHASPSTSETGTPAEQQESDAAGSEDSRSDEPAGLTTAAQAGIGVGAAAGALLAAAVAYLWWKLDKTQKALAANRWPGSAQYPPLAQEDKYYHQPRSQQESSQQQSPTQQQEEQQQQQQQQHHHRQYQPHPYRPPAPFESHYPQTPLPKYELQGEQDRHELQAQNYFVRGDPRSAELSGSQPSYATYESPVATNVNDQPR
ncbi:hypothetical protein VTG60DRAFT_5917 [Thermothelomyces hinnuleus]